MSKATKYCLLLIVALTIGLAVLFFLCYHRPTSQLVTGHSETIPGQPSADDDSEDHCFRQEPPESGQNQDLPGRTLVVVLTMPGADPNQVHVHLFNLNNVAPGKSYVDLKDDLVIKNQLRGDGKIEIRITDPLKSKQPLTSHLGPGPYMVVATNTTSAKDGGSPPTLFYYYETYKQNLSECAMYRDR